MEDDVMSCRKNLFIFLLFLTAGCVSGWGQTVSGTLEGRVVDPSGRAVPGVSIVAIEEATKAERSTVTNDAGLYRLPFVPIGRYTVTFSMPGFKTLVRPGIEIRLNNTTALDIQLELATRAETI